MGAIHVLEQHIAERIAAGEVVERPASVVKELVENAIDAGASEITVELQHGGILYLRVSDNGCGMQRQDVPTAFLRHATSKVQTQSDLDAIGTLGFRGEALAAICAVSRVELLTRRRQDEIGTRYRIEGGKGDQPQDAGCPVGTTVIVRDLFYNTPARMKFLKKDVTEANAVAAVVERIALSHPDIAFRLIRDGKQTLTSNGNGELKDTIYAVCGRAFTAALLPVAHEASPCSVEGYVSKPAACRPNRNGQYFFLNGRLVKSGTMAAALEQAYKNTSMTGKFPACVLSLTMPLELVDVNVHPAKTEVRFADEKSVFNCVYYGVKNALTVGDAPPKASLRQAGMPQQAQPYDQTPLEEKTLQAPPKAEAPDMYGALPVENRQVTLPLRDTAATGYTYRVPAGPPPRVRVDIECDPLQREDEPPPEAVQKDPAVQLQEAPLEWVGEAFETYVLVQRDAQLFLIDKHAAHERILYEKLKREHKLEQQILLSPVSVTLPREEYAALIDGQALLEEAGFELEDFGEGTVLLRALPVQLQHQEPAALLSEIAQGLMTRGMVDAERIDWLFRTMACRAALKAGDRNTPAQLLKLAEQVVGNPAYMHCPHGRPTAITLTKQELEKQFGRIVV